MKRLTLLAAALVMVLGFAVNASAAPEVTISGNILVNAVWQDNWTATDGTADEANETEFMIRERFDLAFTATASENLKAVIVLRSARTQFGVGGYAAGSTGGGGYGGAAASVGVGVNQAYIDFMVPGTDVNVKTGFMPVALPAAVGGGSMIHDDTVTGILASTAFTDNVSMLAGWLRVADSDAGTDATDESNIDAWVVALPLSFEGFSMAPFFVYSDMGSLNTRGTVATIEGLTPANTAAGDRVETAWWAGSSFELSMLDPFILKADVNYGSVESDNDTSDRAGWLFDIALAYTGFDFMNLELAYAYTSGKDDDGQEDGRMPILLDSWALGSFFFGGGLITGDDIGDGDDNLGFHAVALSATGIQSFAEGLTHDAHIVYAVGTNDEDDITGLTFGQSLLEDDSMLELDFNSFYQIYDELTLYNGIGYINYDADENDWGQAGADEDMWKFQIGLKYDF